MKYALLSLIIAIVVSNSIVYGDGNGGGEVTGFADAGGPYTGLVNVTVNFTGNAVAGVGGVPPYTFAWDFNYSGVFSADASGQNVSHIYTVDGTYTVALNVTDSTGNYSIDTTTCTIYDVSNINPVVDFSWSPLHPIVGELVKFTDLSYDYDGTIVSWHWDFGDGDTDSIRNPSNRYQAAGRYQVTLTVTDNDGGITQASNMITVTQIPVEDEATFVMVVYVKHDDKPVYNAHVSLKNSSGSVIDDDYTDTNGSAKFYGISEGYITISVQKDGFNRYSNSFYLNRDTAVVVTLERSVDWWLPAFFIATLSIVIIGVVLWSKRQK